MTHWLVFHKYENFDDIQKCEVVEVCNGEEEARKKVEEAYHDSKYNSKEYSSNQFWCEKWGVEDD